MAGWVSPPTWHGGPFEKRRNCYRLFCSWLLFVSSCKLQSLSYSPLRPTPSPPNDLLTWLSLMAGTRKTSKEAGRKFWIQNSYKFEYFRWGSRLGRLYVRLLARSALLIFLWNYLHCLSCQCIVLSLLFIYKIFVYSNNVSLPSSSE